MKALAETLIDLYGNGVTLRATDPSSLGIELPVLTMQHLSFYIAQLPQKEGDLLVVLCKEKLPPRSIESFYTKIQKQFANITLLYFERLSTRDRQRLAKSKVQFMVGNRFLYAPLLGITGASRDFISKHDKPLKRLELTPAAETILIGQILDARYSGALGREIARQICVTPAAASQALQELEKHTLVSLVRTGKGKSAEFEERSFIWKAGLNLLRNPVEAEIALDSSPPVKAIKAGLSALAEVTMLVDPDVPVWAIHKRNHTKLEGMKRLTSPRADKQCILQLWRRDPLILSKEGKIDPISLYLSLQSDPDERTKKELSGLLAKLGLEVPNGEY